MATIPEVRTWLQAAALLRQEQPDIPRVLDILERAVAQLWRRRFNGPRGVVSAPVNADVREQIRQYAEAHPGMLQVEIAKHFNVNAGRVSEALRGWRK
jgi:hypothetical protein